MPISFPFLLLLAAAPGRAQIVETPDIPPALILAAPINPAIPPAGSDRALELPHPLAALPSLPAADLGDRAKIQPNRRLLPVARRIRRWADALSEPHGLRARQSGESDEDALESYVERFSELLDLDHAAELENARRELNGPLALREALGTSVSGLILRRTGQAPGGLPILSFTKESLRSLPPFHAMSPGDLVSLSADGTAIEGTVYYAHGGELGIAAASSRGLPAEGWRVNLISSEATYQRTKAALERLRDATDPDTVRLWNVLVGRRPAGLGPLPKLSFHNPGLNEYQRAAVRMALAAKDVAVIHGPPGTGKTTTLVELIRQAADRGEKVLATAPSNVAVDNLLEKLAGTGLQVVRLGHPARTADPLRAFTLDALIAAEADSRGLRRLQAGREELRRLKNESRRKNKRQRGRIAEEFAALNRQIQDTENALRRRVLERADVVFATHSGIRGRLRKENFDLVVLDEASQATEPLSWIPLLQARRAVLAGDPLQLPPAIESPQAEKRGLGRTLLERLAAFLPETLQAFLRIQYRMHQDIMDFPSREFYGGRLIAHPSVPSRTAKDLPRAAENDLTSVPVQFIDTAGAGFEEAQDGLTRSLQNDGEAKLTLRIVRELEASGLKPQQIGIITPYAAQVRRLKELAGIDGPEIRSVDGFQGREKEVILLCLVRSNHEHAIGFLDDLRRLNVALTRARRALIVIGDGATLGRRPLYARFIAYAQSRGRKRSALEWPE